MANAPGVCFTPEAEAALERLPESERCVADVLIMRLRALVEIYPERIYESARGHVYQHPNPLVEIEFEELDNSVHRVIAVRAPLPPRYLVFISYSHQDERFRAELCKYIRTLHETGQVSFWHDKKDIDPGTDWAAAIQDAIDRSAAALLIVTQDFIDSRFIRDNEVPHFRRRLETSTPGKYEVFWIPVEDTTVSLDHPWLSGRQHFDVKKPLSLLPKALRRQQLAKICTRFRIYLESMSAKEAR